MPGPVVRKQSPRPAKTTPRLTQTSSDVWGSIDTIRMLLYGDSGSGKTTFWATFPGPILALICSGGSKPGELRSINTPEYRDKITPRIVTSVADFQQATEDAGEYATTVLDHASGLADLILKEILGIDTLPAQKGWGLASQQQYGQQALQAKEHFRFLLNLPGNVVIVAQQRTFGEDQGSDSLIKPTIGAALSPSVTGWLNPACDFVVQTFKRPVVRTVTRKVGNTSVETKERARGDNGLAVEYCLRCEPHETYMTKFRVPKGQVLPDVIVDPDYDKVMTVIRGE